MQEATPVTRYGWGIRVYPYVIAASFPLGMWLGNLSEEPTMADVGLTFALTLMLVAAGDALLRRVMRDACGRSLWLALLVVGWFGYGHGFELLRCWVRMHRYFAPLWAAAFAAAACGLVLICRRNLAEPVSHWMRNTSYFLAAGQLICAGAVTCPLSARLDESPRQREPTVALAAGDRSVPRPDIYYIILDGYAREDVLRELFGFDNRPFLEALRRRGFYIATGARSNYAQTRLSLSSSLSMNYLPPASPGATWESYYRRIRCLRRRSRVVERLRQMGYRYRYVGSESFPADRSADEELSPFGAGRTYLRAFLATTVLGLAEKTLRWGEYLQDSVEINDYQLRNIARSKSRSSPLYTFAHLRCPHWPYLYNRHGPLPEPISKEEAGPGDYVEQLRYLNGRVIELIDAIDRTSGPDAVILLQADHGSDMLGMPAHPDKDQIFERLSIFSAYRCPPRVRERLYPTITPVNSFRVVFGGLFGDDLPVLVDRSFYSPYEAPLNLVEVPPESFCGR